MNNQIQEWGGTLPYWISPGMAEVIAEICVRRAEEAGIVPSALFIKLRGSQMVADARTYAMAEVRERTGLAYMAIGETFAGRDHTTVMMACKRAKIMRELAAEAAGRKG